MPWISDRICTGADLPPHDNCFAKGGLGSAHPAHRAMIKTTTHCRRSNGRFTRGVDTEPDGLELLLERLPHVLDWYPPNSTSLGRSPQP